MRYHVHIRTESSDLSRYVQGRINYRVYISAYQLSPTICVKLYIARFCDLWSV